jgi:hypothetical protein
MNKFLITLLTTFLVFSCNSKAQKNNHYSENMKYESINSQNLKTRSRVIDLDIMKPKIRAEFYVRLYSFLKTEPEKSYEGYEFFIRDKETGLEFSAALTGFGVGYFAKDNSTKTIENINKFNDFLFNHFSEFKDCKIQLKNDFGQSIFGYENEKIIEIDIEE